MAKSGKQEPILLRQVQTLFGVGTVCGLTDGELLERFVARRGELSELAFTALVERHGPMVLGICRRVLADPHDVQDAFQATFLILVRRARSIRKRDSVASWLHGVAYRVACTSRAATMRRRRHERAYAEQARCFVAHSHGENDHLKKVLDEEVSRLPERYRAVVVLCDLEELSYEQAARSLGWPMGTVKSRLARGRDKLRTCLVRRGVAPVAGMIGAGWIGENAGAEVSAELLQTTVRAALRVATHRVTAASISPSVLSLTEGVISTMLLTNVKLSVGALLIGGGLVSLAAFFASPGHGAVAQETRSVQPNPGPPADQALKARLDESAALAAKLQQQVQELRAELQALRATVRQGSGTPAGKVDPTAARPSATPPREPSVPTDEQPNRRVRNVFSTRSSGASLQSTSQPYRRYGGLIFAASPTGNRVIAYDPITHWTGEIELHATKENPLKVSFVADSEDSGPVVLNIEGEHITRIAAFDLKSRTWHSQDLSEPVRGRAFPDLRNTVAYDLGRHLYTFNRNSLSWDHLDLGAIGDVSESGNNVNATR